MRASPQNVALNVLWRVEFTVNSTTNTLWYSNSWSYNTFKDQWVNILHVILSDVLSISFENWWCYLKMRDCSGNLCTYKERKYGNDVRFVVYKWNVQTKHSKIGRIVNGSVLVEHVNTIKIRIRWGNFKEKHRIDIQFSRYIYILVDEIFVPKNLSIFLDTLQPRNKQYEKSTVYSLDISRLSIVKNEPHIMYNSYSAIELW